MAYNTNNVFAKILRGEIPCTKLYEDEFALAFPDIAPQAPSHVVVIPKGQFVSFADFMANASAPEIQGFFAAVNVVAAQQGLQHFRLITNNGEEAGQSVHHFHVHILGGAPLGELLVR